MAEEPAPWQRLEVLMVSPIHDSRLEWEKHKIMIPWAILKREGAHSYFLAHHRFSPAQAIDLGHMEKSTRVALQSYLLTGHIKHKDDTEALRYCADAFGMARLESLLKQQDLMNADLTMLQCLNCHVYVSQSMQLMPCSFKPPRIRDGYGELCSMCRRRHNCACMTRLPSHVLMSDAQHLGGVRT